MTRRTGNNYSGPRWTHSGGPPPPGYSGFHGGGIGPNEVADRSASAVSDALTQALQLLDDFDRYASTPPDTSYAGSPFQDKVRRFLGANFVVTATVPAQSADAPVRDDDHESNTKIRCYLCSLPNLPDSDYCEHHHRIDVEPV